GVYICLQIRAAVLRKILLELGPAHIKIAQAFSFWPVNHIKCGDGLYKRSENWVEVQIGTEIIWSHYSWHHVR
ncbi:hypothetical protein Tsubulata_006036, partial [Turnera subulata]